MSDLKNETNSVEFEEYKKALVELAEAINRLSVSNVDKLIYISEAKVELEKLLNKMGVVKKISVNDFDYQNEKDNESAEANEEDPSLSADDNDK